MNTKPLDLVLGAGGIKGYAHVGVLRAIEKLRIPIGTVTGVSVGAGVAALWTNGMSPESILNAFTIGRRRMLDLGLYVAAFKIPNPMQWAISQSFVSLEGPWREQVQLFNLKPNDRLQIVAFDSCRGKPVVFKGTDYPLATAIAASGSVRGAFVPVEYEGTLLEDGAMYNYNPAEFSTAPAIVVRLGRVTRPPSEPLLPLDLYYHLREQYAPLLPTNTHVDEDKHIVLDIPCEDIAGLSFGASEKRCLQLVDEAEEIALRILRPYAERYNSAIGA
jgi:hypothetical protein